ncbi:PQQ-binding-like beta-propeller repeat protein [Jiangella alba]|uniref:Outer membrane protein assembly factor BamB, contains PQQ-like beta-propeller repeat n=1 Tax=Jiangella alba TaxID=561176 RepID=A0A1H5PXT3_9ACTN|nr:PQQ-binding-like beta-propeller repeat protein [Jiangella alba]SEF18673.1 Outer membrane protein assembly factor BamB, contains PQQ-like beta-propeller repeat [Jiangella alba]
MRTLSARLSPEALGRYRRAVYAALALLVGVALIGPVATVVAETVAASSAQVSGIVYEDANGNDRQDAGERGVEGVSVSDGVALVETDEQGRYQLELDTARRVTDLVFITQPAGYVVGTDEFMTPRFYRSLGQVAAGQTRTADFALTRDPGSQGSTFSFANIADPHVNPQLPEQLHEINSTSNDIPFIAVSGDLTNNATDAEFTTYKNATAGSEVPVWPAVGNHEYFSGGGTGYAARIDTYRRHVGPEWYSFDYGNRHFLVLENNGQAPFDEQLSWIRRDLEANVGDKELIVLAHQPMNVPFGSPSQYDQYGDLFDQYGAELMLVGHEHSNDVEPNSEFAPSAKHIQTVSSSYTIDNAPRGFRFIHLRGETFENPFRMYGVDQALTITSPAPGSEVGADGNRTGFPDIQVNAYDTADEVVRVRYRIDGGSWRPLKPSGELTWHTEFAGRAPAPGPHTIDVEAVDEGGQRWTESADFTMTTDPLVAPVAGADWTQHHGDPGHTGVAADVVDPGLELAWTYRTPGTFLTGSPTIVDGIVYAGTRDENGDGNAALHAVDLATGERLWEYPVPSSIVGTPAVLGDTVFVGTLRAQLFAVDRHTGELVWQRDTEDAPEPNNQRAYGYYSPAVADGKVYWAYQTRYGPAGQGLLVALDPADGSELWASPMAGATMSDGTPAIAGGQVFVGSQTADQVLAFDAATGQRQWQSSAVLGGWQDGIPAAADGRVFIGSNNGIIARDAATGRDLWSYRSPHASRVSSGATPSAPAVAGDVVYMGFPSGAVTALDARTGAVLWDRLLPGGTYTGGVLSSPVLSGETLFVGANNGFFYALDSVTGQPLWQYEIGTWVGSGPAVSGNTVVAGAWDGNLYAFTPGGEAAARWARVTGTVTDEATGAPVDGARVVATSGGQSLSTTTDSQGRYTLGLAPGDYTVSTAKRAFLPVGGSTAAVTVGATGTVTAHLALAEVTGPTAGASTVVPDYGSGSPRTDAVAGETYHFTMNERVQATISSRAAANNQPGTLAAGSLGDLFLLDGTAQETLDWSELMLSRTAGGPGTPDWNRPNDWLNLTDIGAEGSSVVASGSARVDPNLRTTLRYRALADAPVVKISLEIENTGTSDFDGYFQYLLDPDSAQDVAYVPGIGRNDPGYVTSGWTDNFVYVGSTTVRPVPAHGVAWLEDEPHAISGFGYVTGAWFDAAVDAGDTRTISWYHITDYPGAGHVSSNVAAWADRLDLLDDEVADRSRAGGTVTQADTGAPAAGVLVEAVDASGAVAGSARTGADGRYLMALDPGEYTLRVAALGYATATLPTTVVAGSTATADLTLAPVTVLAGVGRQLSGGLVEGGPQDVVMENDRLAMTIAKVFDDGQLPGSTAGKPVDLAVRGRPDQLDWLNLPYIADAEPTGTEAWQQTTVRSTGVEIVQATGDAAIVRSTGTSSAHPGVTVETTYTIRPGEEWVQASSVFRNTGSSDLSVWVGDAMDWDGAGQRHGVAGHPVITTPYESPAEYVPAGRWIGGAGTDPQTYGLVYAGDDAFTAYGNGNWIMSRFPVTLPAGGSYTLDRRVVAAANGGAANPFALLDQGVSPGSRP